MEEIYRFPTKQIVENDTIFWDINYIYDEIKAVIKKAFSHGYSNPKGIGIDSWGVDFGLLNKDDEFIELPISYRDKRTDGIMEKVFEVISQNNIYKIAGIQFLKINTLFQLYSLGINRPNIIVNAKSLLMIHDLVNFFLTGEKFTEYIIASTTSMLIANKKEMSREILDKLGIHNELLSKIISPVSEVGPLKSELAAQLGIGKTNIIAVGSHDIASAIVALLTEGNNWAYLSSGTWSLLGIEISKPILNEKSFQYSFTNEGGINNTIRFLKNIMGLWILQRSRLSWANRDKDLDYVAITELAEVATPFQGFINPDDERFFNPEDMITEIENYLIETDQNIPIGIGDIGRIILENLAFIVAYNLRQINEFMEEPIEVLHIVGGGSKNKILNQFISNACNVTVFAGPVEATAAGNLMTQALFKGDVESVKEIREYIRNSYNIEEYLPNNVEVWKQQFQVFLKTCKLQTNN